MPQYPLDETRLVQERSFTSAANSDLVQATGTVPDGKLWVITSIGYKPSVAETQTVSFFKITKSGAYFSMINPLAMALNPQYATCIEDGLDVILMPGETIYCQRSAHTAGSTMICNSQFIEIDQPLYDYVEPQAAARVKRFASSIAQRVSGGSGGAASHPTMASRTGRSRPLPK